MDDRADRRANAVNWLRATTPRTVLLHIGTNDMFSASAGAPQRLSTLLDTITATAPDAEVFVSTIIPLSGADSQVRTYNAAIPGIVQSKVNAGRRVHLVDIVPGADPRRSGRRRAPQRRGYSKMATVWYNALRSVPRSITDDTPPTSTPPPVRRPRARHRRAGAVRPTGWSTAGAAGSRLR
jgi:hypothetical protein